MLTGIGHSVTPETPSIQLVFNCLIPCQWTEVPLKFVSLFLTVIPGISISFLVEVFWEKLTKCIAPISFQSWTRISLIEQHTADIVPIGGNEFIRELQVELAIQKMLG